MTELSPDTNSPGTFRCLLLLAAVRASLRVLGFRRTIRIARWRAARLGQRPSRSTPIVAARAVARAGAFFPGRAICLEQSITLFLVLRRLGHEATLRMGVQPYPFLAHAWVEHQGQPVFENEENVRRFVPFPEAFA